MFTRKAKLLILGPRLFALLVVGAVAVWSAALTRATGEDVKPSKLRELLKERRATLQEIASQTKQAYQQGKASLSQVHEANQAVHKADLDLCDTDTERVAVLEKMLAEAKAQEKDAEAAYRTGSIPAAAALKATADRLEVEIALERATAK